MSEEQLLITLGVKDKGTGTQIKALKNELKYLDNQYKTTVNGSKTFEKSTEGLKTKIDYLGKRIEATKTKLQVYKNQLFQAQEGAAKKREELAKIIKEKAIAYYIAVSSNEEIDEKGIAYANNKVFLEACTSLKCKPDLVLSDGYLVKNLNIDNKYVIKGDTKSASIAAASIVAKVYRDNLMKEYGEKYPGYYFEENAGYGTSKHIEKIKEIGPCDIHRKSFLKNIL